MVILDGAGDMLPEGGGMPWGTFRWADYLERANKSLFAKRQAVEALFRSDNYGRLRRAPENPLEYDLDGFDMESTRNAIKAALESKASLPHVSKQFVTPFPGRSSDEVMSDPMNVATRHGIHPDSMKKGTHVMQTVLNPTTGLFMEEGVSTRRRDNPGNTVCASCGSPHDLKACAQCGQCYYCSKACQRVSYTFFLSTRRSLRPLLETLGRRAQEEV